VASTGTHASAVEAPVPNPRRHLGRSAAPCLVAVAGLVTLALGVPLGSLGFWLVTGSSTAFPFGDLVATAATTFGLGIAGALTAMTLAFPIAWLCVRRRGRLSTLLERSTYFGNAVPGIVVALALVTVSIRFARPAYQTVVLLVLAYAIMFLPRAMISIRAALDQAPPSSTMSRTRSAPARWRHFDGSPCRWSRQGWALVRRWCSLPS